MCNLGSNLHGKKKTCTCVILLPYRRLRFPLPHLLESIKQEEPQWQSCRELSNEKNTHFTFRVQAELRNRGLWSQHLRFVSKSKSKYNIGRFGGNYGNHSKSCFIILSTISIYSNRGFLFTKKVEDKMPRKLRLIGEYNKTKSLVF